MSEDAAITDQLPIIRPFVISDEDALYRICLITGDSGDDASALYEDARLLGHIYAGPYGRFSPECCLVVEDGEGVGGYILGALDTPAFEQLLEAKWWPALRSQYPKPCLEHRSEWSLDDLRAWQVHHPARAPAFVAESFPSHVHIDLEPRLQGRGLGLRLLEAWIKIMRQLGSKGAHLGVGAANLRAVAFYRRFGWLEIGADARSRALWFGLSL